MQITQTPAKATSFDFGWPRSFDDTPEGPFVAPEGYSGTPPSTPGGVGVAPDYESATLRQRVEQTDTRVHEAEEGVGDLRKVLLRQAEELDKHRELIVGLACRIAELEEPAERARVLAHAEELRDPGGIAHRVAALEECRKTASTNIDHIAREQGAHHEGIALRVAEMERAVAEMERREGSGPALALDTACRACGNPDAHYWDGLRATYCSLCAKDAHLARLHPWRAQAWSAVRRLASAVRFLAPAAVGAAIALGVAAAL